MSLSPTKADVAYAGPSGGVVRLDQRLVFVTGKGGVGKTTISAGLARMLARRGKRVLLCAVDQRRDLADVFGLVALTFSPTKVDDRLSVMAIDTEASLREYLKIYLRVPIVGRIGPLAAAFDFVAAAAPGVREILTIGKLCYEVREHHYDVVVVDAPSTGHVVGYLGAPRALRQLVRVGPILNQTDWMSQMLADPATTGVVVVTTPEEMPVRETLELLGSIERETATRVVSVVANRVPPDLFVARDAALVCRIDQERPAPFDAPGLDGLFDAARIAAARRAVASEYLALLRAGVPPSIPLIVQPFLFSVVPARRVIAAVAQSLDEEIA